MRRYRSFPYLQRMSSRTKVSREEPPQPSTFQKPKYDAKRRDLTKKQIDILKKFEVVFSSFCPGKVLDTETASKIESFRVSLLKGKTPSDTFKKAVKELYQEASVRHTDPVQLARLQEECSKATGGIVKAPVRAEESKVGVMSKNDKRSLGRDIR